MRLKNGQRVYREGDALAKAERWGKGYVLAVHTPKALGEAELVRIRDAAEWGKGLTVNRVDGRLVASVFTYTGAEPGRTVYTEYKEPDNG